MAIRIKKRHALGLTPDEVREIRSDFFHGMEPTRAIAERYPVTENVIKDAIHGKRGYAKITDDIPQEIKDNRVQWRTFISSEKSKRARDVRQSKKILADFHKWQREQAFGKDADELMARLAVNSERYNKHIGGK